MDIQIASNFERLLFDISNQNDERVNGLMRDLKDKGSFDLNSSERKTILESFIAEAVDDTETIRVIRDFFNNFGFILRSTHSDCVRASYNVKNDLPTVVLGTAHVLTC